MTYVFTVSNAFPRSVLQHLQLFITPPLYHHKCHIANTDLDLEIHSVSLYTLTQAVTFSVGLSHYMAQSVI